jgi:hypothetical protein
MYCEDDIKVYAVWVPFNALVSRGCEPAEHVGTCIIHLHRCPHGKRAFQFKTLTVKGKLEASSTVKD